MPDVTLSQFEHYVTIATIVVIPAGALLADGLYGAAMKYVAFAATTPSKADDVRAARLLASAKAFVDAVHWVAEKAAVIVPLLRRFIVVEKPLNRTPAIERVENGTEP